MKILAKSKDYYDYLTGIYGVDNKIVLDRTNSDKKEWWPSDEDEVWSLLICGKRIDFVYKNNKFYYLKEIEEIHSSDRRWGQDSNSIWVKGKYGGNYAFTEMVDDKSDTNKKANCPIMLVTFNGYAVPSERNRYKYPILKDLNFNKIMNPQEIYLLLSDWLSPRDVETNNPSDKEKIVSNGFDLKYSFRNIK